MSDIKISPKYGVNPTIPVCFWCGNEKNEVALMGKVGKGKEDIQMPMHAVIDYVPCEECQKQMAMGVPIMEVTQEPNEVTKMEITKGAYPTGQWVVVKREAMSKVFTDVAEDAPGLYLEREAFQELFGHIHLEEG